MKNMIIWLKVAALGTVCGFAGFSLAADRIWTGEGADGNWSTAANWGGSAPVANDTLLFGGTTGLVNNNDLAADTFLNGITFLPGAGAFNLSGNRVAMGGNVTHRSTAAQTFGLSFALQQDTAFMIKETAGTLTMTGIISGAHAFTKNGPGLVQLWPVATHTYTGDTIINGGQLSVNWKSIPNTSNPISTSSGLVLASGILALQGNKSQTLSQSFDGTAIKTGANVIGLNTGGTLSAALGALTRDSGATLNVALTYNGTRNLSSASWTANQTITESGVAYSTLYTGDSTATPPAAGNDWAAFNGTTVIPATYTPSTPSNLTDNANIAADTDTILSNDTAVTSLRFAQAQARTIAVAPGKTLTTGGILVSSAVDNNLSSITNGTLRSAATVADRDLVIINNNTSSALAIGSVIADAASGATGLTKSGPGALNLTGANTYTGPTVVNAGNVVVGSVAAKSTAQPLGKGDITLAGGRLSFVVESSLFETDKNIHLAEGTTSTIENNAKENEKGILGDGRITGAGNLVLTVKTGSGYVAYPRLIMLGSNTFSGSLRIDIGTLQVNDNPVGDNADVTIGANGLLRMETHEAVTRRWNIGALSSSGIVQGGYKDGSTTLFAIGTLNTDTTISNRFEDYKYGKAALAKVGTGTLTLSRSGPSAYSGPTTVEEGTLKIGINDALPTASAVTVFEGAVLDVGATTNAPPSISGDGTLRMSGTGRLNVSGALNVTNMTLEVTDLAALSKETHVIATGSPVTGPFEATNVVPPWAVKYSGTEVRLVYNGGTMIRVF
ncbi:MAG: autotransporter-associated beta strand repeat-containing protein [Kiritimatiellae bacterium]|nr:autotransporter-associated beta strand repeat-containing protein [Kiritimatiellia bacterium]